MTTNLYATASASNFEALFNICIAFCYAIKPTPPYINDNSVLPSGASQYFFSHSWYFIFMFALIL